MPRSLQILQVKEEENEKVSEKFPRPPMTLKMFEEIALNQSLSLRGTRRTRTWTTSLRGTARTARVMAWILRTARITALILRTARWLDPPDLKWPDAARRLGDRR